jgi:hypothetical protein
VCTFSLAPIAACCNLQLIEAAKGQPDTRCHGQTLLLPLLLPLLLRLLLLLLLVPTAVTCVWPCGAAVTRCQLGRLRVL